MDPVWLTLPCVAVVKKRGMESGPLSSLGDHLCGSPADKPRLA